MVRQTLLVVVGAGDEDLLHLAGTMLRYGWQGVRTVLVVVHNHNTLDKLNSPLFERIAALLSVEQLFQWQDGGELIVRLARTCRAFQPQIILATPALLPTTRKAWEVATDETVGMAGVPLLNQQQSTLWSSGGNSAIIDVPLTAGIRHALACLWDDKAMSVAEFRRTVAQKEWAVVEQFEWVAGELDEAQPHLNFFRTTIH